IRSLAARLISSKAGIQVVWRACGDTSPSAGRAGFQMFVAIVHELSAQWVTSLVPGEAGFALGQAGAEPRRATGGSDRVKKTVAGLGEGSLRRRLKHSCSAV